MWPPSARHNVRPKTGWRHNRVGRVLQPCLDYCAAQVENLRYVLMLPKQLQRAVGQGWLTRALSMAALTTVLLICGCQVPQSIGRARTDFLALRYLKVAEDAATGQPADFAKIVNSLDRAMALAPDHPLVVARAGRLYMVAEAYQRAIPVLLKAQRTTGQTYYYELGTCYLRSGDTARGIASLEQAVRLIQYHYQQRQLGALDYAMVLNNVGYTYADAGIKLPRAKRLIAQAVRLAPLTPSFIDSLGWAYFRQGDYHNAAFYLERAVRQSLDHPNAEIYYHLGVTYAHQHHLTMAREQLQRALQLRPHYPEALNELRQLYQQLSPSWQARLKPLTSVYDAPGSCLAMRGRIKDPSILSEVPN